MPTHLELAQWGPFPLDCVFAFFSNPENLPRLMPPDTRTRLEQLTRIPPVGSTAGSPTSAAAGVGTVMVTSFRVFPFLPIRARWIARITEFEWNHHFADVQQQGPFKSWHHRHEFVAETREGISGTVVRDVIDYEPGFGFLGEIVNAVFVRRRMENTFVGRQERLLQLLA